MDDLKEMVHFRKYTIKMMFKANILLPFSMVIQVKSVLSLVGIVLRTNQINQFQAPAACTLTESQRLCIASRQGKVASGKVTGVNILRKAGALAPA